MPKENARYLRSLTNGTVYGWSPILARRGDMQEISEEDAEKINAGEEVEVTKVLVVEAEPAVVEEVEEEAVPEEEEVKDEMVVTDLADAPDDILAGLNLDDDG